MSSADSRAGAEPGASTEPASTWPGGRAESPGGPARDAPGPGPADGPGIGHRERLWPGPWAWLIGLGLPSALGIAYGAALGALVGWLVGGALAVVAVLVLARMATVVAVREAGVSAGRALLPWSAIGRVMALDADGTRRAKGPDGDPTAHLVLRPGVGPGAVVLEVVDPADPHGTWLVASRDPAGMARAILRARDRLAA